MAASFPTSYDALTNPTAGSLLTSPSHADQHINANDIVEAIEQRVGLSGSAFPGSPTTGQFFHRTDRRIDYYYDGTRWLSSHLYNIPIAITDALLPLAATATAHRTMFPFGGTYDLWITAVQAAVYIVGGTALSASHKWVCTFVKEPASATIATITIDSGALNTWRNAGPVAVNALLGITNFALEVTSTKTGTPGTLYFVPSLMFRLVG